MTGPTDVHNPEERKARLDARHKKSRALWAMQLASKAAPHFKNPASSPQDQVRAERQMACAIREAKTWAFTSELCDFLRTLGLEVR
jgi:hypothetical protein